jgi:DNA-binding XRE family transcriptional regulator
MTPTPRQVGVKLRRLRQVRRLSQAAPADRAGFSRTYVNKIEAGRYDPPLSTLNSLAKALRITVEDLVRGSLGVPGTALPE